MHALVVEDDQKIAKQITQSLSNHGFAVDVSHDGEHAWFLGDTESYDIVILDLGLPSLDGLSLLNKWRQAGNNMPILILTARDTWREKVTGLRAGADDYLAKPFEMEEMLARVEVLIRRASGHSSSIINCGVLQLDLSRQRISKSGYTLELSALEYRLLAYLIQNQEKVISKSNLSEHIYQQDFAYDSNVIEVLVNRCRNKVGKTHIKTLRGQGYILCATPDD